MPLLLNKSGLPKQVKLFAVHIEIFYLDSVTGLHTPVSVRVGFWVCAVILINHSCLALSEKERNCWFTYRG